MMLCNLAPYKTISSIKVPTACSWAEVGGVFCWGLSKDIEGESKEVGRGEDTMG